jgi:hypothetical protein
MKFTYRDVVYWIEFQYESRKKGKKTRNYTFARIKTGDRDTEQIVAEGRVARFVFDPFDKEHARQFALESAIDNNLFFRDEIDMREFRRLAHIAYHRRPGGLDYERAVSKGLVDRVPPQAPAPHFNIQTA